MGTKSFFPHMFAMMAMRFLGIPRLLSQEVKIIESTLEKSELYQLFIPLNYAPSKVADFIDNKIDNI